MSKAMVALRPVAETSFGAIVAASREFAEFGD